MPPNFPTILGKAVPTMVVSRAASDMPSIRAMVTMIFVFLVIDVFAYPMLNMWEKTIRLTKHSTRSNLFQENALLETGNREVAIFPFFYSFMPTGFFVVVFQNTLVCIAVLYLCAETEKTTICFVG